MRKQELGTKSEHSPRLGPTPGPASEDHDEAATFLRVLPREMGISLKRRAAQAFYLAGITHPGGFPRLRVLCESRVPRPHTHPGLSTQRKNSIRRTPTP